MENRILKGKYTQATCNKSLVFLEQFLVAQQLMTRYDPRIVFAAIEALRAGDHIPENVVNRLGDDGIEILTKFCSAFCPEARNPDPCDWCRSQ